MMKAWKSLVVAGVCAATLSGCVGLVAGGAVGATLVATDRRTSGAYADDQVIETRSAAKIAERLPSAHVNVTSFNRAVLLTGEVPSAEARAQAEQLVRGQPGVQKTWNYLVVAPASPLSARSNDTWITSKVRARMLDGQGFSPNAIKVVTERGVVYLLGLVTPAEGEAAARVASETAGVTQVITVFEPISEMRAQ
ncbi:BON domain-containing protein [Crenobacter caeni]|uniref:BON domain-containing protein n=1 Tax=Crenobacter caeni TaxID=2705474 RepID=A0A6B2KTG6_9NEIS|nr:BON domain-containing protein [Crenobacter caeni]NDV13535.1 BON domain-containing protein [Crenobacter caeni]